MSDASSRRAGYSHRRTDAFSTPPFTRTPRLRSVPLPIEDTHDSVFLTRALYDVDTHTPLPGNVLWSSHPSSRYLGASIRNSHTIPSQGRSRGTYSVVNLHPMLRMLIYDLARDPSTARGLTPARNALSNSPSPLPIPISEPATNPPLPTLFFSLGPYEVPIFARGGVVTCVDVVMQLHAFMHHPLPSRGTAESDRGRRQNGTTGVDMIQRIDSLGGRTRVEMLSPIVGDPTGSKWRVETR